jgi:phosphoribosylglycinamide formyltransferase-1
MRAAVLISGSGTNLQAFIDRTQSGELELDLCVVLSNKPDAAGLERARNAGIAVECLEHRNYPARENFDAALVATLDRYHPDLVILAGFMRVLTPVFIDHFAGAILNIHPSLLPKYPGLDTHQRVLDAGDKWHGSTVHFVTEELDGGPSVIQGRVPVKPGDTAATLAARVLTVEHRIYPEAAALYAAGRLEYRDGHAWLDDQILDKPLQYA